MKIRILSTVLIALSFTACSPVPAIHQVSGEEAIKRITADFPSSPDAQIVDLIPAKEQALDDLTIQISQYYIDGNSIAIGMTTHSASGKRYSPSNMSLTYSSGAPLPFRVSLGLEGSSDDLGISLPPGDRVDVIFFKEPNSPEIVLPFDGILTLSYDEQNLWHEITKLGQAKNVGPFQFQIAIPDQKNP